MWFFGRGEVSLRPFSFDRKLFAKIAGSKKKWGATFCAPLVFCKAKEN